MSLQRGVQRTMGPDASAMAAGRPFLAVSHPARDQYRATPGRPAFPATSSVVGQSAWPECQPTAEYFDNADANVVQLPPQRHRKGMESGLGSGIGWRPGCRKQGVPRGDHDDHRVWAERRSGRRRRVNRIGPVKFTAISWAMRSSLTDWSCKSTCSMIPALFIKTSTLP